MDCCCLDQICGMRVVIICSYVAEERYVYHVVDLLIVVAKNCMDQKKEDREREREGKVMYIVVK